MTGWLPGATSANGAASTNGAAKPAPVLPPPPAPVRMAAAVLSFVPLVGPALGRLLGVDPADDA
jgi:hypothetical protein